MLSNISDFNDLFERYENDPGPCSRVLRTEATEAPKNFLTYAVAAILSERPVTRKLKFIAELALSAGLIEYVIKLHRRSREQAIALALRSVVCSVRFDRALVELLQLSSSTQLEEAQLHAGLDLLSAISKDERFVPDVLKLLKHPNPKIRSKAALFVGSRTQNLSWAASRGEDDNARVRANILESLYGLHSDAVHQLFRENVHDENNRAAGNAILGLYLLGDTSSIPLIYDMAGHKEARFRNTCAWLMGRVRDARFSQMLSGFMSDPDELVRRQALKSLGEVRKALKETATKPEWKTVIVRTDDATNTSLIATVHDNSGLFVHGIPATSFIVKTGTPPTVVRDYTVEEYNKKISVEVGFIVCLPPNVNADTEAHFIRAIQSSSGLRRSKDKWSIIKVLSNLPVERYEGLSKARSTSAILNIDAGEEFLPAKAIMVQESLALEYSAEPERIDFMMNAAPVTINALASDEAGILAPEALLDARCGKDHSHLILVGAGSNQEIAHALYKDSSTFPATVHVLALSVAWQTAESRSLASATGGIYKRISNLDELQQACLEVYSSLLQHYRISWKDGAGNLRLDVNSAIGRSSVLWECDSVPNKA